MLYLLFGQTAEKGECRGGKPPSLLKVHALLAPFLAGKGAGGWSKGFFSDLLDKGRTKGS